METDVRLNQWHLLAMRIHLLHKEGISLVHILSLRCCRSLYKKTALYKTAVTGSDARRLQGTKFKKSAECFLTVTEKTDEEKETHNPLTP